MNEKELKAHNKQLQKALKLIDSAISVLEETYENNKVKPVGDVIMGLRSSQHQLKTQL